MTIRENRQHALARLFYGNFDVEHELAGHGGSLPASVRRLNVELPPVWIAIAEAGDAIFSPEPFDESWLESLVSAGFPKVRVLGETDAAAGSFELCPWGWSSSAVEWGRRKRCDVHPPALDVVRTANSRVFSLQLEQQWNVGLPGACVVRSDEDLYAGLRRLPPEFDRWVLKAEFGMSGRKRLSGRGTDVSESAANWVRNRIRRGEPLVLEPWVERMAEVGLQFTIPKIGEVVLEGVTGLLSNDAGVYRGSRMDAGAKRCEHWEPAISVARRAAEQLRSLGYFGPLGIDAVEYRDADGNSRFRPLQDVNARYTMGRLALGFRRLLQPREAGVWLHQRWSTTDEAAARERFEQFCNALPSSIRMLRTSPFAIGGQPVGHGTVLLMGPEDDVAAATASVMLPIGPARD